MKIGNDEGVQKDDAPTLEEFELEGTYYIQDLYNRRYMYLSVDARNNVGLKGDAHAWQVFPRRPRKLPANQKFQER